jgi:DNA primase
MIPNDFIQTLLARVDIVQVVDRHVPLKKAGANFSACCPFHSEKTASFTVSPTKQFYHCFGCGAHGTAIGFLMEHAGKSFPDAVEELARDAGLEVPRTTREDVQRSQGEDLSEPLLAAMQFYRSALKESPRAIDYLKGRGLTGAVAARFGIGYAPDDWQPLAGAFESYQDKALETAGLVITGEGGKRYDRFRDRIIFPIHDARGRVIGFGGRVLGTGEPKYLNSPETPVFSKGRELYGLFQARQAIRSAERVVVVEGYMDVVALAQHGVEYAVATLGTATTPQHAQKLFRLTDTVVFCFDGDDAGKRAAWRALENALPVLSDGKQARFLFLPDGEDPDDAIRRRGREAFEGLIDQSTPLSEFLVAELTRRFPPVSAEGRAALLAAAKPLLAQVNAPMLAILLRRQLAAVSGLPETELGALMPQQRPPAGPRTPAPGPTRSAPSLLRDIIKCVLPLPELARKYPLPKPIEGGEDAAALSALADFCAARSAPLTMASVMQHFAGSLHEPVLEAARIAGELEGLSDDSLEIQLKEGVQRYQMLLQKRGTAAASALPEAVPLSPEEAERARQRGLVQDRLTGRA